MGRIKKLLPVALIIVASCSSSGDIKDSNDPEKVYNEGARLLKDHDYLIAEEYFSEVRRRFPQSRYAVMAQLASADVEFEQDNFLEAATTYGLFVDQYPKNEKAPYAQYRKAESFFKAAPENVARDQTQISDAITAARNVLKHYGSTPFAAKAKDIVTQGRLRLAQKEAYVAAFYERKDHDFSALRRWKGLQRDYSDIGETKEGAELLKKASEHSAVLEKKVVKE